MNITGVTNNATNSNYSNSKKAAVSEVEFSEKMESINPKLERSAETCIGFGPITIGSGTVTAFYADDSTEEEPVVVLTKGIKGEELMRVNINDIDPSSATKAEMFALCGYLDNKGLTAPSTFGSYTTLMVVEEMATHNGFMKATSSESNFSETKIDWTTITKKVADLVFRCKDMAQYLKIKSIADILPNYEKS